MKFLYSIHAHEKTLQSFCILLANLTKITSHKMLRALEIAVVCIVHDSWPSLIMMTYLIYIIILGSKYLLIQIRKTYNIYHTKLVWFLTLTSWYLYVNRTTIGRQHIMMHWSINRIVLNTQFKVTMHGSEFWQVSHPSAQGRHWKSGLSFQTS